MIAIFCLAFCCFYSLKKVRKVVDLVDIPNFNLCISASNIKRKYLHEPFGCCFLLHSCVRDDRFYILAFVSFLFSIPLVRLSFTKNRRWLINNFHKPSLRRRFYRSEAIRFHFQLTVIQMKANRWPNGD